MSCRIQLDREQYNSGEIMHGRVICSSYTRINIRGVEVKLKGKENNKFGSGRHDHAKNRFLESRQILVGEGTLGPGTFFEYPFSIQLPTDLPSTFTGPYGGVYFTIKAKVDIPFHFDYTDKKTVNIMSPINFNAIASYLQLWPVSYTDEKTVGSCFCTSSPISMEIRLQKTAFVVGEVVKINVVIDNMTDEEVKKVVAKLKMTTMFKVTDSWETKARTTTLAGTFDRGRVSAHRKTYNLQLNIPQSTEIPNFQRCKLFSQQTKLEVTAVFVNGSNLDFSTINVTMGHIPVPGQGEPSPVVSHQPTFTNRVPLSISLPNPPTPSNDDPPPFSPPPEYETQSETSTSTEEIDFTLPKNMNVPPYPSNPRRYSSSGPSAPLLEASASAPPIMHVTGNDFIKTNSTGPC